MYEAAITLIWNDDISSLVQIHIFEIWSSGQDEWNEKSAEILIRATLINIHNYNKIAANAIALQLSMI